MSNLKSDYLDMSGDLRTRREDADGINAAGPPPRYDGRPFMNPLMEQPFTQVHAARRR
jgi:hypothetical protein